MYSIRRAISSEAALVFAAAALALVFAGLFSPNYASAAAITVSTATTSSNNASSTLAKVGDVVSYRLVFSGTPWEAPKINIWGMGTTSMSGSGTTYTYSTTTASVWTSGPVSFLVSYGGTTVGDATSTLASTSITSANVRFDKTAPTGYNVGIADTIGSSDASNVTVTFDTFELYASYVYVIGSGTATTSGNGTVTDLATPQVITGINLSSFADGTVLSLAFSMADAAGNRGATTTDSTTIDLSAPSTPVASPEAGSYTSAQSVTLTSSGSDSIRYTTDGSTPTCSTGTVYSGAISALNITIKAIGCDAGLNGSSVASFEYPRRSSGGGGSTRRATPVVAAATTPAAQNNNAPAHSNSVFTRDLEVGVSGDDVKALQAWLNAHGFPVAATGPGSKGMETTTFGALTKAALAKFQAANGIPAIGRMGPMTRAAVSGMQ